jgi:hypothetical protein
VPRALLAIAWAASAGAAVMLWFAAAAFAWAGDRAQRLAIRIDARLSR